MCSSNPGVVNHIMHDKERSVGVLPPAEIPAILPNPPPLKAVHKSRNAKGMGSSFQRHRTLHMGVKKALPGGGDGVKITKYALHELWTTRYERTTQLSSQRLIVQCVVYRIFVSQG